MLVFSNPLFLVRGLKNLAIGASTIYFNDSLGNSIFEVYGGLIRVIANCDIKILGSVPSTKDNESGKVVRFSQHGHIVLFLFPMDRCCYRIF